MNSTPAPIPHFDHAAYAVLGAGKSGLAASRLLLARGKRAVLIDERADTATPALAALAEAGVSLRLAPASTPEQAEAALAGCDAVVVSPGFPADHPLLAAAARAGLPARSELELAWLCRGDARVVAITGTNGKTTVTMMIEHIMKAAGRRAIAAGNIGHAFCDAVLEAGAALDQTDFALEVSSFQLETVERFCPDVAIVLNVTADHLDRHPTMDDYALAKQRVTQGQGPGQVLVINQDDPYCMAIGCRTQARVRRFSLGRPVDDGAWLDGGMIETIEPGQQRPRRLMAMDDLPTLGLHNVANAMAAACAVQALGVDRKMIAEALATFHAAPHRLEPAGTIGGVRFIDDSKATNLDAMLRALESFEGNVWLIAGGRDKNSPFASVSDVLARRVKAALLIGEAAAPMQRAWDGWLECIASGTLEQALATALERAQPGDVVLLSPGCASFDQFRSYAHRGEVFAQWVQAHGGGEAIAANGKA